VTASTTRVTLSSLNLLRIPKSISPSSGKAGHRLAFNDRFPGLWINNARQDCRAVTHGPDDAAPISDICCDGLEIFSRWIVIKCSVTGGRKEQSVILALQLRGLLESRVKLDIERMLWVAKSRFVASRQELQHQRHLVNSACAGLGGQVDLKAGVGQDFEREQGLGVERASLETARIDSNSKTRDRNQGFSGKGLGHVSVLHAGIDSMTPAVQVLQS